MKINEGFYQGNNYLKCVIEAKFKYGDRVTVKDYHGIGMYCHVVQKDAFIVGAKVHNEDFLYLCEFIDKQRSWENISRISAYVGK